MSQFKLKPFVPLILLVLLAVARMGVAWVFVRCEWKGCEPIPEHLNEVLLAPPPSPTPTPLISPSPSPATSPAPVKGQSGKTTGGARDQKDQKKDSGQNTDSNPEQAKTAETKTPTPQASPQLDENQRRIQTADVKSQQYSGRLVWLFITLVCAAGCIVACWQTSTVILKPIRKGATRRSWLIFTTVIAAVVWAVLAAWPEAHMILLLKLIRYTLVDGVTKVQLVVNLVNSFAFATALFLTMGIVTILWECETENKEAADAEAAQANANVPGAAGANAGGVVGGPVIPTPMIGQPPANPALDRISEGMRRLQNLLYVATVMLVSGVLLERSVFQWSLAFLWHNEAATKPAQALISSIVAVDGGFFTLALAAVYIPAALILRKKGEELASSQDAPAVSLALQSRGLSFSLGDSLPKLVAILAPLLAGPVGELFMRLAR